MHHHYLLNKLHSYLSQFINQHATPCPVIAKAADDFGHYVVECLRIPFSKGHD